MDKGIKCQELFAYKPFLLEELFSHFEYPWEIIAHLGEFIASVIKNGPDGYERLSENVLIGKNAKISPSAYIEGPAIIGHGCDVRHGAVIRGCVLLGEGCVLGNSSEIKNSIMMDGAHAPHFNYIGDSILGKKAHIGAGVICSNLRSDGKNVTVRTERAEMINTGLRKLGAILGDNAEIGCGAVLCPGTIVGKNTTIYPLTMARGIYPRDSIVKDTCTVIPKKTKKEE